LQRYEKEGLKQIKYRGIEQIPVKRIVGSVNRWRDFDNRFRTGDADQMKLNSIMKAFNDGIILPPISVYKIRDDYYVIDGNHRVTVAKRIGQIDIDAEVYELLPPGDSLEHRLWRERSLFEIKTGITVDFSEIGAYERLYVYLRLYAKQTNKKNGTNFKIKELHKQWHEEIYQPIIRMIESERLDECFPMHTRDDLFLFILHHQITKSRLQGRSIDLTEAMAAFVQRPGGLEAKLSALFKGFVFKKRCTMFCEGCQNVCPEGLICMEDGRLAIDERCGGCGKCTEACPEANLEAYEYQASSPTEMGKAK